MKPLKKRATYDDLREVPEHFVAEMFDGELYASPRPAIPHSRAASVLGAKLGEPFDHGRNGPGGWLILDEPEIHFGNDVLVPDIAGWRRERLPALSTDAYFTLAPDWVCEVLSPATESLDRGKKLQIYAREGVAHAWLVEPLGQALEVLSLRSGRWERLNRTKGEPTFAQCRSTRSSSSLARCGLRQRSVSATISAPFSPATDTTTYCLPSIM